ncbi:MAG: N-acetyltransferase [Ignavibacteria bacterium]|nr:N-acetyltransferase [Ignavibacteria bacterium]HRJ85594.1 N-acetyltransferase [Ignavibacteria bacterium]
MRDQWVKELYVRGEKAADYDTISEINRLAFGREEEANLVNAIRKTKSYEFGFSLVAVKEDIILGHVLFSRGFITHRGRRFKCLILGPIAVHPEHQRKGIGKALVNEGLERAKEVGFGAVIVVGDPAYYSAFGFKPAGGMRLRTTLGIPDENFMAKEISRNALRGILGTVMFPREFLALAEADKKREAEKAAQVTESPALQVIDAEKNEQVNPDQTEKDPDITQQQEVRSEDVTGETENETGGELPVEDTETDIGDKPADNNVMM